MSGLIVVFGTTAILAEIPCFPGQEPVYTHPSARRGYRLWSSGRLELALAASHEIYVVTVVPIFRPEDAWWRELVAPDRIYRPVTDATGRREDAFEHFINEPWKRFMRDIGRPWPDGVDDAIAWRETLDGSDGLLYGGRLTGYAGSA